MDLINQVDVKVKLYIISTNFALLAKDNSTDFKIQFEIIYILVKKIKVNPAVIYGHSQILEKQNDLYCFTKVECRSQSIALGSTSFHWKNMFQWRRPNKVMIGFVNTPI